MKKFDNDEIDGLVYMWNKTGDEIYFNKLLSILKPYINKIVSSAIPFCNFQEIEDFIANSEYLLLIVCRDYKPEKGKFVAFLSHSIKNRNWSVLKKERLDYFSTDFESEELPTDISDKLIYTESYFETGDIEALMNTHLSHVERVSLSMFSDGWSYNDIAKELNCSYKQVDNAIFRSRNKLRPLIQKNFHNTN